MERNEVESRVKKVVASLLKINLAEVTGNANFIFDLGADSMQSLELVAAFEEEFGVELDQDKALAVQTVDDAVNFISGYVD
ncbi:MAG: acyl carrier protein [Candidatus Neomarinimicrobiota bacterium]